MKLHFLIIAALFAVPVFARAEVSPITIRVEQTTAVSHDKLNKTQEKALKVFVSNGSAAELTNLNVKYFYFGHDVRDHESAILERGERKASVKARATEIVATPAKKATMTEAHYAKKKKIEATGEKLTGYGVQVFGDEGKLLAEYFSEPSLKAKVSGGGERK